LVSETYPDGWRIRYRTTAEQVRQLCRRRWGGRVVSFRAALFAAVGVCETEHAMWLAMFALTGPAAGIAQVVASREHLVLAVAGRHENVEWTEAGGDPTIFPWLAPGEPIEASGVLWHRAVTHLGRHGIPEAECWPRSQNWFSGEGLETGDAHPQLERARAIAQAVYARSLGEADEIFAQGAGGVRSCPAWREAEGRARRRLIRLAANDRLRSL
jgi:hypothetical protein